MSRVIFGVVIGMIIAGGLIVGLEYYSKMYNKGRADERERVTDEIGPVDG